MRQFCGVLAIALYYVDVSAFAGLKLNTKRAQGHVLTFSTQKRCPSSRHGDLLPPLRMFGGMFGGKRTLDENGEMTAYTSTPKADDYDVEFQGLADYVEKWSELFNNGGIPLTTPVQVVSIKSETGRGVQLLFKNTNTGYKSKNEEDKDKSSSQKKKSEKTQGGIEILVEKAAGKVVVRAQRCEIEEEIPIKEMSEATILKELQQAIGVWKKDKK